MKWRGFISSSQADSKVRCTIETGAEARERDEPVNSKAGITSPAVRTALLSLDTSQLQHGPLAQPTADKRRIWHPGGSQRSAMPSLFARLRCNRHRRLIDAMDGG